ncbi:MAG: hypothetical protein LBF09_07675 [Odoribacteraceae bacterium]|jgi:hypothetical protein|nr:hypothetical protein [Odoribacteraceae bacterium]
MKQVKIYALYFLLALSFLATACVRDVEQEIETPGQGELYVTFVTGVPGQQSSTTTRAMTLLAENTITRVDLLAFKVTNGGNTETLDYHAIASGISDNEGDGSKKKIIVRLRKSKDDYRFVLLANLPVQTSESLAQLNGGSKESVLDGILREEPASGKWMAGSAAGQFAPIPMWAETGVVQVNDNLATTGISNIAFTRAMARFDVLVASEEAKVLFSMQEIYLYNRASRGKVVPVPENWETVYKQASMPGDNSPGSPLLLHGPLLYNIPAASEHAFEREIYTFETGAASDALDATCIVIGGMYAGSSATSYYRLDIKDDQEYYRDVLRNHVYTFKIIKVEGPGYETPDEAFRSAPMNMVATITPWNEEDLNDITFTGQYHLSVDKSQLDYHAEGAPASIEIMTDYPGGWQARNLPTWLEFAGSSSGVADTRGTLTIRVKQNETPADREDYFLIVAGNIEKPIIVKQTAEPEFSLKVTPEELIFYKNPSSHQEVQVIPYPAADGNAYNLFFSDNGIKWASGFGLPTSTQTTLLRLKPTPNTGTTTLNYTILVTLDGPNGQVSRVINVKQLAREMFLATLANPYPKTSGQYTFTVVSDAPWKLSTGEQFVTLEDSEKSAAYHPATASYTYTFSLATSTAYANREATVSVTSSAPGFPSPCTFNIVQEGWPPVLNITDPTKTTNPTTHVHDFKTDENWKEVTIETNARWKYTTDANFANVFESNVDEGVVQSVGAGYTPDKPLVQASLQFRPINSGKGGAPGSTIETEVTFETVSGDSNATEARKTLRLSRTVPVYFRLISPTTIVAPSGQNISVTFMAETNVKWYIAYGAEIRYQEVSGYEPGSSFTRVIPGGKREIVYGYQLAGTNYKVGTIYVEEN